MNFHEINLSERKNLKALIKSKDKIIALEGGAGCFHASQKVITPGGPKSISEINQGDHVLSCNEYNKQKEFKPVQKKFIYQNTKPCIKIKLKNGHEIIGTEDHKIYYKGGWYSLKHIVSLWNESKESRDINKR